MFWMISWVDASTALTAGIWVVRSTFPPAATALVEMVVDRLLIANAWLASSIVVSTENAPITSASVREVFLPNENIMSERLFWAQFRLAKNVVLLEH